MSLKKRGLGRGLEALLVNVSTIEEKHQLQTLPIDILQRGSHLPPDDMSSDELQDMAIELLETIQKENLSLLQEAEALRKLIDEFEAMVRHF
jgi:hypothetical protein